jgi:hypothetical protein
VTADEWIAAFAAELGADAPNEKTISELLELAATAAHNSERIAAPIACYMAGRDGRTITELMEIAEGLGEAGGES